MKNSNNFFWVGAIFRVGRVRGNKYNFNFGLGIPPQSPVLLVCKSRVLGNVHCYTPIPLDGVSTTFMAFLKKKTCETPWKHRHVKKIGFPRF